MINELQKTEKLKILERRAVYIFGSHGHVNMYLIERAKDDLSAVFGWELPEEKVLNDDFFSHNYHVSVVNIQNKQDFQDLYIELFENAF